LLFVEFRCFALCTAMTYAETLDYLYAQLPMFSRVGTSAYKKDLHNTLALLHHLGNPHRQLRCIHVAGTNGKGSTSHMLAAALMANGYRVGLYTSPHLYDFRERIKISGVDSGMLHMVPQHFVCQFVDAIRPQIEAISPSFFELTVAMAFAYFAQQAPDMVVVETGLGGRLDSTNVIEPELSIITNIGWDHMNILGDSLEAIAAEKAGIIKQGVPVVVGETLPETLPIFEQKAAEMEAPMYVVSNWYTVAAVHPTPLHLHLHLHTPLGPQEWRTDLPGLYQQANLCTVLTALHLLQKRGYAITPLASQKGLAQVQASTGLMGRWQVLAQNPTVVLDVAHNAHGMAKVIAQIEALRPQRVHMVLGMVKDKDHAKVLRTLPTQYAYYFAEAHLPRALPAAHLAEAARMVGLTGLAYGHVNEALAAAIQQSHPNDIIIVCGSVFLVAEVDVERFCDAGLGGSTGKHGGDAAQNLVTA
jgi:dihydrofolate synthase / folylpolyglutamate synthase